MHTEEIRVELSKMACPIHQKHPVVILKDSELHVAACCPAFRNAVVEKMKYLKEKFKVK